MQTVISPPAPPQVVAQSNQQGDFGLPTVKKYVVRKGSLAPCLPGLCIRLGVFVHHTATCDDVGSVKGFICSKSLFQFFKKLAQNRQTLPVLLRSFCGEEQDKRDWFLFCQTCLGRKQLGCQFLAATAYPVIPVRDHRQESLKPPLSGIILVHWSCKAWILKVTKPPTGNPVCTHQGANSLI